MEEVIITPIEWQAPEYSHKERSMDWFWTIGLIALIGTVIAFWFHNYVFGIFILISGACLIMFTMRPPQMMSFSIKTEGLSIGKDEHIWKSVKGFSIKSGTPYNKLMILTSKKFLPVYTIPFPESLTTEIRETLSKVIEPIEIEESKSMLFAEKLGF